MRRRLALVALALTLVAGCGPSAGSAGAQPSPGVQAVLVSSAGEVLVGRKERSNSRVRSTVPTMESSSMTCSPSERSLT